MELRVSTEEYAEVPEGIWLVLCPTPRCFALFCFDQADPLPYHPSVDVSFKLEQTSNLFARGRAGNNAGAP